MAASKLARGRYTSKKKKGSFIDELGCDTVALQFGVECRLVVNVGRGTLCFVIAARDGRGGLLARTC